MAAGHHDADFPAAPTHVGRRAVMSLSLAAALSRGTAAAVTLAETTHWDIESAEGNRHRILLARPSSPPPPGGYPVVFLLDGSTTFPIATAFAQQQEKRQGAARLAPALLIGMTYPDGAFETPGGPFSRDRDYTLTGLKAPDGTGQADAFLDFISGRVIPEIASQFPIDRRQLSLFGHSFGGLCALHSFLTRPAMFGTVIAASPSIWWQEGVVLQEEQRYAASLPPEAAGQRLLLTVGSLEQRTPEQIAMMSPERQAAARRRLMIGKVQDLAARMASLGPRGPRVDFVLFDGENHGSVVPPAVSRAMRFALEV
ncbi:alpha/beta hydrolase [Pseudoroseomonas globiformis]|uniref:Alpha/beta hydrolase n=1 Tax=Teichococcus globiformis TaxID=2307229 RepID=A0ABV7FZE7_9PROT